MELDEAIIMNESFLNELNNAIDKTIKEKEELDIDYNLLEHVLAAIVKNQRFRRVGPVKKLISIKKEEILSIALDFFKSIDDEFYQEAINTILQQRDRTKMGIYDIHKVKNFNEKDENELPKYSKDGSVTTYRGNSYVHIPLQQRLKKEESGILGEDEGTLEDLYTVVHEISHLFDLNKLDTILTAEELIKQCRGNFKRKMSRELFGEATAIAFEGLLTDYLLEKRLYPESALIDIANIRTNSSLNEAIEAYSKIVLASEKQKNGKITIEFLEDMMKKNNMNVYDIRRIARRVIDSDKSITFQKRYAVGGLVAPTIVKSYESNKENGVQALKTYLKAVYDDDFHGALKALGIELTSQGIDILVRNMKIRDAKINKDNER